MSRLDLCAARLCRQGCALLPEEGHQAAATQGGLYVRRGAVENFRRPGLEPGPITTADRFATRWSSNESNYKYLWLWVPAFAGTTMDGCCSSVIHRQHRDLRPQHFPA